MGEQDQVVTKELPMLTTVWTMTPAQACLVTSHTEQNVLAYACTETNLFSLSEDLPFSW